MGPSTLGGETSRKRRVRHALPPARWPTREEAARSRWFEPLRLGASVVAEQRTWVPAMVPWRATEEGFVTSEVLDWYGRFAEGQPGRRALRAGGHETPVVTSGGITTFEQAESILARGKADAVAAARQSLADPDWFRKIRLGLGHLVRRCEFTNYCEGLDQRHKQVTCKLWDRVRDPADPGAPRTADGRRLIAPPWTAPDHG